MLSVWRPSVNETIRIRAHSKTATGQFCCLVSPSLRRPLQLCDNARLKFGSHPAFIRQQAQTPTVVIHLKIRWIDQLPCRSELGR